MNDSQSMLLNYLPPPDVIKKNTSAAQYALVTHTYGNACNCKGDPYINNCNLDTVGTPLQ